MTHIRTPQKAAPSPWAIGLFLASASFAAVSLILISTGYIPA